MTVEAILSLPAAQVAPRLLGCHLIRELDGQKVVVKIVETEAYAMQDAASHSHHGETPRTKIMFGPPGYLYVYFTYGMHYCCNIVTGPVGDGSAVLIRAIEPLEGREIMEHYRPGFQDARLSNGPAKLCQALNIGKDMNGHNLAESPLRLTIQPAVTLDRIKQTTRIGISTAKEMPWRFYLKNNDFVSRPL